MPIEPDRSIALFGGHPLLAGLAPIPIACFAGTFLTDLVYWKTKNMQWANMSAWLLTVGLLLALFLVIAGAVVFLRDRRRRQLRLSWLSGLAVAIALLLAIVNAFIHSRDAYTSVVPTGITLSGLVLLMFLAAQWTGGTMVYRRAPLLHPRDPA